MSAKAWQDRRMDVLCLNEGKDVPEADCTNMTCMFFPLKMAGAFLELQQTRIRVNIGAS